MAIEYMCEKDGVVFVKEVGDTHFTGWVKKGKGGVFAQLSHDVVEWTTFKQEHPEWRPHPENRKESEDVSKMEKTDTPYPKRLEKQVGDNVLLQNEEGPLMVVVKKTVEIAEDEEVPYVWVCFWSERKGEFLRERFPEEILDIIELNGRCP